MNHLIVLFNLKSGASREAYEAWAKATDIPHVRALPSIAAFDVFRATGVRGSDRAAPYEYVELISIRDMEGFGKDVAAEAMRKVAAEFREFAEAPLFVAAETL